MSDHRWDYECARVLASLQEEVRTRSESLSRHQIIFLFGAMGAGKTTFLKTYLEDPAYLHVSIDDYVQGMYNGAYTVEDLYRRAREIGNRFTDWTLEEGVSQIIEATGKNADIFAFMERLKEAGFTITSYFLKTPLEMCLTRVQERNKRTDRKVSIDAIKYAYRQLWEVNYEELVAHSDHVKLYTVSPEKVWNQEAPQMYPDSLEIWDEEMLQWLIPSEVQLVRASFGYAQEHAGTLLKELLTQLQRWVPETDQLVIESQVVCLKEDWYGAPPGWRGDLHPELVTEAGEMEEAEDVEETEDIEEAEHVEEVKAREGVHHYLWISGHPSREFLTTRQLVLMEKIMDESQIDRVVRKIPGQDTYPLPPMTWIRYSPEELSREIAHDPKKGPSWRLTVKATVYPPDHPAHSRFSNRIRTQAQVYVPC